MKIFCDNCMGENEIDEKLIKKQGFRARCEICGHMIFFDSDEVEALLMRRKPVEELAADETRETHVEDLSSMAQSNITTTIAAKIDIPQMKTSSAVLSIIEGPDTGLEFAMDIPRLVFGRKGADINLNDQLVSRRHMAIEAAGGRYLLKDLGSTNGTFINGTPASMDFLKHGDQIQVGATLTTV